jgi:hydroxymethylbilane synthase
MSRALQGGCQAPIGGFCVEEAGQLYLRGFVADLDGVRFYRAEARADMADPESLGRQVAHDLIGQGADRLMAELAASMPAANAQSPA